MLYTQVRPGEETPAKTVALVSRTAPASRTWEYTVRSGNTLSGIALAADETLRTVERQNPQFRHDWNLINIGQRVTLEGHRRHLAMPVAGPAALPVQTTAYQAGSVAAPSSSYDGSESSFQVCVIARESGGNPQIMNASGHYGLYQFSYDTWVAYGGDPDLFGHASAAYQTWVFNNAMARGGEDNWAPYDGC